MIKQVQLYDDKLDFIENKKFGPFGGYANIPNPYVNKGEPKYDFFGRKVYSPFGIGAGPLPSTRFIKAALDKGYDIVTLKNVRTDVFPLNPYPHVRPVKISGALNPKADKIIVGEKYEQPLAVANSFGIPSVSPKEWQPYVKESANLPALGQTLVVAFQGIARGRGREEFVKDHVHGMELIRQTGDHVVEVNLACPNEGEEVLACFDTEITVRIVEAIRNAFPKLKLIVKIAYFTDKKQLEHLIKKIGTHLDGITAINTVAMPIVDANGKQVFPGRKKAGVSGAPIKWAGIEMVEELYKLKYKFDYAYKIIGLGGVLSFEDYRDYQNAGADYVMSVTGAMWIPDLAAEIKASL